MKLVMLKIGLNRLTRDLLKIDGANHPKEFHEKTDPLIADQKESVMNLFSNSCGQTKKRIRIRDKINKAAPIIMRIQPIRAGSPFTSGSLFPGRFFGFRIQRLHFFQGQIIQIPMRCMTVFGLVFVYRIFLSFRTFSSNGYYRNLYVSCYR